MITTAQTAALDAISDLTADELAQKVRLEADAAIDAAEELRVDQLIAAAISALEELTINELIAEAGLPAGHPTALLKNARAKRHLELVWDAFVADNWTQGLEEGYWGRSGWLDPFTAADHAACDALPAVEYDVDVLPLRHPWESLTGAGECL